MNIECIWPGRAILGESPVWHPGLQALFWLDIERQRLYRYQPQTKQTQEIKLARMVTSLVIDVHGNFMVSWEKGVARMSVDGQLYDQLDVIDAQSDIMFNDGKCDRQGRFWMGTKHLPEKEPKGMLYCKQGEQPAKTMDSGYVVLNGPCFSPDGVLIYVANSPEQIIYQFDLDVQTGQIANKRIFAKIAADAGYPDGMTVDAEGFVWSGHWGGWRITRYSPDGLIERVIDMPVPNVTSVCFGGRDLDRLYVTSAARDVDAETLKRAPLAGGTFVIDVGVKGIPEPAYCN